MHHVATPFHQALLRDKATFTSSNVYASRDTLLWSLYPTIKVTAQGYIIALDTAQEPTVLVLDLQSCHLQIFPTASQLAAGKRRFSKAKSDPSKHLADEPPVLFIRSQNNAKLYIKLASRAQFGNLLLALMAWQNMRPQGLARKWFAQNRVKVPRASALNPHELLVCRFKVYGPIPAKAKSVHVIDGPRAPHCVDEFDVSGLQLPLTGTDSNVVEGWFYTMGVLKLNGALNFITELDGTLLYTIDVKQLLLVEIRKIHHSICNSPNTLFVGLIKDLRLNNIIKSTSALSAEALASQSLLTKDGKPVASHSRILIEFPLHIDLEDWFVGLNYFCKREYIGIYNENSKRTDQPEKRVVGLEGTLELDSALDTDESSPNGLARAPKPSNNNNKLYQLPARNPRLSDFSRDYLRVSKKLTLDIIEAKFEKHDASETSPSRIYAEVFMWGFPWARTSTVAHNKNPFWKEEFSTYLPILTQMIRIVIKKCHSGSKVSATDDVVGTVYVTPDILTHRLHALSTMNIGSDLVDDFGSSMMSPNASTSSTNHTPSQMNNIVRLSIYDATNLPIGKLLLTVDLKEYLIPPPSTFRALENMLQNCPMKSLIEFCNNTVGTNEFQSVSFMLLDIFQSLGIEEEWFKALIENELITVDKITRKNYGKKASNGTQNNNVFNTLFRGSSIFTKSLEKYIFRIGQEYLEKVFGNFFEKVISEKKNCEIDPRYVRLQEKAHRRGKSFGAIADDSDDSDDEESGSIDQEEEEKREARVQQILEENFKNLLSYSEEIWSKIISTSNDLPQQIKNQLKNFRTKVDLACDPEDKTTSLNCLSAFVFLRFFCPAILNPKLFYLTKEHQTGMAQRTLTVIAKILLNLANRQQFSPHKEAHLVRLNGFLKKHEHEVYEYFDRITGRKNDFNEKVLELSHEMNRFDLGLSNEIYTSELPTTPYLIDKYLRLTEFIHLLLSTGAAARFLSIVPTASRTSVSTTIDLVLTMSPDSQGALLVTHNSTYEQLMSRDTLPEIRVDKERDVYQIGSLEFERSDFLNLAIEDESEGFIKSLCRSNDKMFSFITSNINLGDLQKQSAEIVKAISALSQQLQQPEVCQNYQHDEKLWEAFVNDLMKRACLETVKNAFVFVETTFQSSPSLTQRLITDNALSTLKLRFPSKYQASMAESFSSATISGLMRANKNPFRRWLKRDQ